MEENVCARIEVVSLRDNFVWETLVCARDTRSPDVVESC